MGSLIWPWKNGEFGVVRCGWGFFPFFLPSLFFFSSFYLSVFLLSSFSLSLERRRDTGSHPCLIFLFPAGISGPMLWCHSYHKQVPCWPHGRNKAETSLQGMILEFKPRAEVVDLKFWAQHKPLHFQVHLPLATCNLLFTKREKKL